MSLRLMGMVWRAKLPSGTQKLVAARLADFADDDGCRVFPSNARVARDCSISDRAVRDAMRGLEDIGVLILVAVERPGQHMPREYRFNLDALVALAEIPGLAEASTVEPSPGGSTLRAEPPSGRNVLPPGEGEQGERGSGYPTPGGTRFRAEGCSGRNVAPKQGERGSADPLLDPRVFADDTRERISTVGREVLRLIGVADDPRWLGDWGRVAQWLADGYDPDLDIYPTIRRVMDRRKGQGPPHSLQYFDDAVRTAHTKRNRPMLEGKQHYEQRRQPAQRARNGFIAVAIAEAEQRNRDPFGNSGRWDGPSLDLDPAGIGTD